MEVKKYMERDLLSGAISGAIDPNSQEASEHAEMYYEEIRNNNSDVKRIATYLGKSEEQILMVKNYLFVDEHILRDRISRFDPEIHIAQSWQRLAFMQDKVMEHDRLLILHELMEMDLVKAGVSQIEAHELTNQKYNYTEACDKYDESQGFSTGHYSGTESGAITQMGFWTH